MQFWILVLALTLGAYNAHAQRVYAPEITGPGHVKYENETLVFVLSPDKIEKIETSEYQVHIQMTQAAREYFYTLTKLNVGKKMIIKSGGGETIQEAIIQKPIDSGIIISRPIKDSRAELARFLKRIVTGQEPIEIKPRDIYVEEKFYEKNRKIYDTGEAKGEIINQLEDKLENKDKEIMELRKQLLEIEDYNRKLQNGELEVYVEDVSETVTE
ncbi:MAG: hypothetical protein CMF61_07060 [Magnetococcales bacterium]|nr:hypothetical protein [Magnetococcales bacterium]